jgi:hypothetical protein
MAPVRRTLTCGQTGCENTGAKTAMTLINMVGRESIAILASLRNEVLSLPIHGYANRIFWTKSSLEAVLKPLDPVVSSDLRGMFELPNGRKIKRWL